ncbi:hypothetical protein CA267_007430 [Alteromonas pelagimontana]|uniref:Capsule assembly Wzi family protein n=1 Tax=Alteromonas pelagimontana TaxID=1858656 RepID=A0A6M4MBP6_9ALTE|nr:capsule assembly Wzi family protein [Alteromonas pelagimontana]QJR80621.1 hypothetical protein CA267_007430 [Alteromonas pelagimontana]
MLAVPNHYQVALAIGLAFMCFTETALAKGVSANLPLQVHPRVEAQIDKLMAITSGPPLTKPYKVVELERRVKQIESNYLQLFNELDLYLQKYQKAAGITDVNATVAVADSGDMLRPNTRGGFFSDSYSFGASGFYQPSDYLLVSAGGTFSEHADFRHTNTYVTVGMEYIQLEAGYREHWFSPFKYSSMLVSTHAKTSPSVTFSNASPITSWDIRYEIFYAKLEEVEEIRLGENYYHGSPRHGGIHLSFSPLDFWSIGINRTLQFGGGARSFSFGDVFEALLNPAGKDNVGDIETNDPNYEFGNQQASVTTVFNLDWGTPFQLYGELGGEDTVGESNYSLGNQSLSFGIYLPALTDSVSLRLEHNQWATKWYVHHLYPAGYTNAGVIMGQWAAEQRLEGTSPKASVDTLGIDWQIDPIRRIETVVSLIQADAEAAVENYETGYQIQLDYTQITPYGEIGVGVLFGKSTLGENQSALQLSYFW